MSDLIPNLSLSSHVGLVFLVTMYCAVLCLYCGYTPDPCQDPLVAMEERWRSWFSKILPPPMNFFFFFCPHIGQSMEESPVLVLQFLWSGGMPSSYCLDVFTNPGVPRTLFFRVYYGSFVMWAWLWPLVISSVSSLSPLPEGWEVVLKFLNF